jgi:hypothetical protein
LSFFEKKRFRKKRQVFICWICWCRFCVLICVHNI